jgi:hypothetical protein
MIFIYLGKFGLNCMTTNISADFTSLLGTPKYGVISIVCPDTSWIPFSSKIPNVCGVFFRFHRWEWGEKRASLNEPDPNMPIEYRGNYLHGKQRPGDYTHGCICERSEHALDALLLLDPKKVPAVPAWVTNNFTPPK